MSILELYESHNVAYQTEGDRHCRPGWINTPCPFCTGNPGPHLGVNLITWHFNCWRCGWHPTEKAIAALIGITERNARGLIREYKSHPTPTRARKETNKLVSIHPYKRPPNTQALTRLHARYLERRGFDPHKLISEWGLTATGPASILDGINYKFRIVAPINWNGSEVSFQTRDCTNKHPMKYLACPKSRENIHHKHILYGNQSHWGNIGICVEGIADVWRMGPLSFALFGIQFSTEQLLHVAKRFRRVAIVFDSEPQANKQANLLAAKLRSSGTVVHVEKLSSGDPGSLSQDDADHLVRTLTKEYA